MAFTLTTTAGAVALNDTTVLLTSITGVTAGALIGIDNEVMKVQAQGVPTSATVPVPVQRGVEGTAVAAHPLGAQVRIGATASSLVAADWTQPQAGAASIAAVPAQYYRDRISYSAAGAITLPRIGGDMVAILNGTTILAMTLANPSSEQDGSRLTIIGNGKAAHTVAFASSMGNNGTAANADVLTFFATAQQGIDLMACGGFWCSTGVVAGAATLAGIGVG